MASTTTDGSGDSLQQLAHDAEAKVRLLAQGLAHAGASPQALKGLSTIAQTLHAVSQSLASSPEVEDAAKNGPGVDDQGNGGPQGPLAPQTPANKSAPVPGAAPGSPGGPPPNGPFGAAAQHLHQAMNGGKPVSNRA